MVEVRILWSAHLFCNMKKKLLIIALVAGLLPTLFSCVNHEKATKFVEDNTSIREIKGYELLNSWDSHTGISISIVVTDIDTIVIWSKYKCGSVIVERKPIIK